MSGEPDAATGWTAALDDGAPAQAPLRRAPWGLRRSRLLGAVVAAVAAVWVISATVAPASDDDPATLRSPAVVGNRLGVPVSFRVPPGAAATSDGSLVRLRLDDSAGTVLVLSPTEVVEASGRRAALPDDLVAWLQAHPGVLLTRTRQVPVGGRLAAQVDYRLMPDRGSGTPPSSLQLFCGWQPDANPLDLIRTPCTRITAGTRVRATFVPFGDRVLLVEAVWSSDWPSDGLYGRMPRQQRYAYYGLLAGLTPA